MPVQLFNTTAQTKFEAARRTNPEVSEDVYRDILLLEFKEWFKTDFFSWVDSPPCPTCGAATKSSGMCVATSQEQQDGAGRGEGYKCEQCGLQEVRFPRYHGRPEVLLETRRGRCGEWANCFVLCCRALGFDTRHVLDWTDHVWAEVWSEAENRWLHVDPRETVDHPLVYEAGWGKKLTYVVAFSREEVQDVTWRYSRDHAATRSRRQLVRPAWLVRSLLQLSAGRSAGAGQERRAELLTRRLAECLEMLTPRQAGEGDLQGRQTGSLAWRLARGEAGRVSQAAQQVFRPPTGAERFSLRYNCATDQYLDGAGQVLVEGFQTGLYSGENVARKVEPDWDKVYIAREEGCGGPGRAVWRAAAGPGRQVDRLRVRPGRQVD